MFDGKYSQMIDYWCENKDIVVLSNRAPECWPGKWARSSFPDFDNRSQHVICHKVHADAVINALNGGVSMVKPWDVQSEWFTVKPITFESWSADQWYLSPAFESKITHTPAN